MLDETSVVMSAPYGRVFSFVGKDNFVGVVNEQL